MSSAASTTAGETVVDVRCYAVGGERDGEPRDAQFNLSYLTNRCAGCVRMAAAA